MQFLKKVKVETKDLKTLKPIHKEILFWGHMFLFVIQMCRKNKNQLQRIPCELMHIKSFSHEKNLKLPAVGPSRLTLCSGNKIPDAVPAAYVEALGWKHPWDVCALGEARPAQPHHLKALNRLFGMLMDYAFFLEGRVILFFCKTLNHHPSMSPLPPGLSSSRSIKLYQMTFGIDFHI